MNQLFKQLGGNAGNNQMQAFQQFMQDNRGKDPNAMIQQIVSSGKISQAQLDQVQGMYSKMSGMFDGMKHMFGF